MNPPCARCKKTVYPTEKLNCLDKIWHKLCFKCETCGMTLNMKNYKGYKKLPYCSAHYPTTKFTAVADTPENLRIKKNTTNQSGIVYHQEFEKEKGKFTSVTDDPETMRTKKTQQQASGIAYTQEFEKEKGKFTSVTDDPETMRTRKTQQQASGIAYKGTAPPGSRDGGAQPEERKFSPPSQRYQPPPTSVPAAPAPEPEPEPEPEPAPAPPAPSGGGEGRYVAIYDYAAADDDEVSFNEGDIIMNGEPIDEGWMTGTVERTGETGMLPSNYVEPC